MPIMLGSLPPCASLRGAGGSTWSRRRSPVLPLTEVIICLLMSFLRFCACNVGFIAIVEGGVIVVFVHVEKEEELLPEDSGSLTPLASPA